MARIKLERIFCESISWHSIYYYFNKWSKDGSFKKVWINLLSKNKKLLDMSCIQLDGSHSRCRMGGEYAGYQGRKKSKMSNSIFLCDNQGQMLAMSSPKSGKEHDLFKIDKNLNEILKLLKERNISHKGLFLNADTGFDSDKFRKLLEKEEIIANIKSNKRNSKLHDKDYYFDPKLYKRRF